MSDITDRRPSIPTATIPFAPLRSRSAAHAAFDDDELRRQLRGTPVPEPAPTVEAAAEQQAPPEPPRNPTDVEYVANSFDRLRHLDLKLIVKEMFGGAMPKDEAEAMDKIAEWSSAHIYPKGPRQ